MRCNSRNRKAGPQGFTLIEMIVVIIVTGIIATIMASFIARPVQGYADSVKRAELTDAADAALRRMARDIRLALPNSLRVDTTTSPTLNFIEFIITSDGGRYRYQGDGSVSGVALDYVNPNNKSFDVLGPMPVITDNAGGKGDFIVVLNLGPGYAPADAYQFDTCGLSTPGCNIAQVSGVAGSTVTLISNPYANQTPPLPSPNNRFQVVPYETRAVKFICPKSVAGNLTRYWGYGFADTLASTPTTGSSALLVANAKCSVKYTENAQFRIGLIAITLTLTDRNSEEDPNGVESISLFQQIHVDNSP